MNENINLCEILKDCPKGHTFWSPMLGNVEFLRVIEPKILVNTDEGCWEINSDSTVTIDCFTSAEPMLFPSKDQRDWSKWKCPKPKFDPKTLKPFDKVLVRGQVGLWSPALFTYLCDVPPRKELMMDNLVAKYVIPYNDETKLLVGTTDEAPEFYRYWED